MDKPKEDQLARLKRSLKSAGPPSPAKVDYPRPDADYLRSITSEGNREPTDKR